MLTIKRFIYSFKVAVRVIIFFPISILAADDISTKQYSAEFYPTSSKYFSIDDFLDTQEKTPDLKKEHTSKEHKIMGLKQSTLNYPAGSKWLIKRNQFTWIVNEYVASKLYQWALGKDYIADTVLVKDPLSDKIMIATKIHNGFIPFDNDQQAKDFSFKCVVQPGEYMSHCNGGYYENDMVSYYHNKPVIGFEKAFVASRIFSEDDDINNPSAHTFYNYALKTKKNSFYVTRYDFDGSLKFFDTYDISSGMTADSVDDDKIQMLGDNLSLFLKMVNAGMKDGPGTTFSWNKFYNILGYNPSKKISPNFLAAFTHFLGLDKSKMKDIIDHAFNDIKDLVGDETFEKYYDIKKLDEYVKVKANNADKLALFTMQMIEKNLEELDNWLVSQEIFVSKIDTSISKVDL